TALLPLKFPSPAYDAAIRCEAAVRLDTVIEAKPDPFRFPVPKGLPLSVNDTVPVGMPTPGALADTVVEKVTDWPKTVGSIVVLTLVDVVFALFTTCVTPPVLPEKLVSPLYTAVIECEATLKLDVVNCA